MFLTKAGKPARYDVHSEYGDQRFEISGSVVTVSSNGRKQRLDVKRDIDFVFENNVVALLWLFVKIHRGEEKVAADIFHVDSRSLIQYTIQREGNQKYRSSRGEELDVDDEGLKAISVASQGIKIERTSRAWPAQSTLKSSVPPLRNEQLASDNFSVVSEGIELGGTITYRRGSKSELPAILFVSGSGPQDRYGTINEIFLGTNEILEYLALRGFVVFSMDNRPTTDPSSMSLSIRIKDYEECLRYVNGLGYPNESVILVGHSEGALVASVIAQRHPTRALVLMAPPFRPLREILVDQIDHIMKNTRASEKMSEDAINEYLKLYDNLAKEYAKHGIVENLRSSSFPTLLIQGDKDYQVSYEKDVMPLFDALKKEGTDVTMKIVHNADHLFKEEKGVSTPIRYLDSSRHVSKEFFEYLSKWIAKSLSKPFDRTNPTG